MKADFFRKKILMLAGTLSVAAVLFSVFYARVLTKTQVVDLTQSFYFLVSEEENATAAAETISLSGGAGYVLTRGDADYAVLSCYFTERDAKTVKDNLAAKKIPAAVLAESGGKLYLKKNSEKRNAEKLAGCFNTMNSCIHLLYDIGTRAETGEYTQQKLKRALEEVKGVLSCLSRENRGGVFTEISVCGAKAAEKLSEISRGVVYAKDIRYVQVYLSDCYLSLASKFSL